MRYQAKVPFYDKEDGYQFYAVGESYPREGVAFSEERYAVLLEKDWIVLEKTKGEKDNKSTKTTKK